MSQSNSLPSLPLCSEHVARQFARRGDLSQARFLYDEVARRMAQRLRVVRLQPQSMLDAGCGAGDGFPLLRERYSDAAYTGLDHCRPLLTIAERRHRPAGVSAWLRRRFGKASSDPIFLYGDMAHTGLAAESQDLVWSNLALHWHPEPHAVLAEWRRILKVEALATFSWFGPGTLRELRHAVTAAKLNTATPSFVDMHDFGDLLVAQGYVTPVMDQETIVLTYSSPQRLLADVRALGGNPARHRRAGLLGRDGLLRLCEALEAQRNADGLIPLSIEVAYGHAWRAATHRAAPDEVRLAASAIGRKRPVS